MPSRTPAPCPCHLEAGASLGPLQLCLQQGLGALQPGKRGQQLVPLGLQAPHLLAVLVLLDEALRVLQLDPVAALDGLEREGKQGDGTTPTQLSWPLTTRWGWQQEKHFLCARPCAKYQLI